MVDFGVIRCICINRESRPHSSSLARHVWCGRCLKKRQRSLCKLETMANNSKVLDSARCMEMGRTCACFSLRRAARAITRLYDDFLRPSGLRSTQYSVLIAAKLRGPVTLTKLAKLIVNERTTLTRNLTVLEKKGFIRVEPGKDRREHQVTITEKGQEALTAAVPLWEAAQARIEGGLGGDRMGNMLKDLSEIVSLSRRI